MSAVDPPYYRRDLARVHHLGYGFHADLCAPGLLSLLEPVRARGGLVLELGCGSGLLTRYLLDAGHRVIATDASPAMLELAAEYAAEADVRRLVLPDDPLPDADAVVSIGHVLSYLPTAEAIERALTDAARAVRPGGLLAIDLCDLRWGEARRDVPLHAQVHDDWTITTRYSMPSADRFVREMTIFTRNDDGSWRRDDERHDNVLIDTSTLPALLARQGVTATVGKAFGAETLPEGLAVIVGHRPH
jgi:SAM-dependent methyltransferase